MATLVRLLVCQTDGTIEEIPDFDGPPDRDDALNYIVAKHRFPDGNEHFGNLMTVEKKHWEDEGKRKSIIAQIRDRAGHTGLDQDFYDTKNTLQEDAMTCWTRDHNRPAACPDYKSDAKKLFPDTSRERKELGMAKATVNTYLCDYCPVKSMVQTAYFDKSGARD